MEVRMLHASNGQKAANVVCFHSYTRDRRLISVPEVVRQTFTGVLQQMTTTEMENGMSALVIVISKHFPLKRFPVLRLCVHASFVAEANFVFIKILFPFKMFHCLRMLKKTILGTIMFSQQTNLFLSAGASKAL